MNLFNEMMKTQPHKILFTITGGGMEAATIATRYGGASSWFYGAFLPYAYRMSSLAIFEDTGIKMVSREAALQMADLSCRMHSLEDEENYISVSATSKLAYEGEREGRAHVAYIGIEQKTTTDGKAYVNQTCYEWHPRARDRFLQDQELTETILAITAFHAKMPSLTQDNLQRVWDALQTETGIHTV